MEAVLDLVAELRQHRVRNVPGVLGDEIDPDALAADQLDHLFDPLQQELRHILEQKVRLVEEEDHLRQIHVPGLRQGLEQLADHIKKEQGIEGPVLDQALTVEDIDHALSVRVPGEPVRDPERRLPEEDLPAHGLQGHHRPEDRADRDLADVAVLRPEFLIVLGDVVQHRLQVLRVDQEQALLVRYPEDDRQDIGLEVVEA